MGGNLEEVESLRRQLRSELSVIEEDKEAAKQAIRDSS